MKKYVLLVLMLNTLLTDITYNSSTTKYNFTKRRDISVIFEKKSHLILSKECTLYPSTSVKLEEEKIYKFFERSSYIPSVLLRDNPILQKWSL